MAASPVVLAGGHRGGDADEGRPEPRPEYRSDYYSAFLRDPDGNRAEAAHHGTLRRSGIIDHLWIRVADVAAAKRFYRDAPAAERRGAHAALAGALRHEQRAWHLAAAAVGPDERAAAELEGVGNGAAARRAFGPSAAAFERSARLTWDAELAARRLLAAGQAAGAAGAPDRALVLLGDAARTAASAGLRARAEHLRGRVRALVVRGIAQPSPRLRGRWLMRSHEEPA